MKREGYNEVEEGLEKKHSLVVLFYKRKKWRLIAVALTVIKYTLAPMDRGE